jgi:hypothetical protein
MHTSEELRRIDDEIANLHDERQLAGLKTRRNSFSPLCRLPSETLSQVLQFVQIATPLRGDYISAPWIDFDPRWVAHTLLCRRVRTVALETPSLWTFISSELYQSPTRWTSLCVSRASGCALDIVGRVPHQTAKPPLPAAPSLPPNTDTCAFLSQTRRLCLDSSFLRLFCRKVGKMPLPEHVLTLPMPRLEFLACKTFVQLPASFLGSRSSAMLARMQLEFVDISANHGPFDLPMLSFLSMTIDRIGGGQQFAALLKGSPRLQILVVETGSEVISAVSANALPRVVLPGLQTLFINCVGAALAALLHIIPAPSTHLSIDVRQATNVARLDHSAFQYVLDFWSRATGEHCLPDGRLMHINLGHRDACELRFGQKFPSEDVVPGQGHPRVSFKYPYGKYPYVHHDAELAIAASVLGLAETVHFFDQCLHHNKADMGPEPRHVVIKQTGRQRQPPPVALSRWIDESAYLVRPLDTITIHGCPEVQVCAQQWTSQGIAKEVLCEQGT